MAGDLQHIHWHSRRCTSCGRIDQRERWPSKLAAELDGALVREWACEQCGGVEFTLLETADCRRERPSRR